MKGGWWEQPTRCHEKVEKQRQTGPGETPLLRKEESGITSHPYARVQSLCPWVCFQLLLFCPASHPRLTSHVPTALVCLRCSSWPHFTAPMRPPYCFSAKLRCTESPPSPEGRAMGFVCSQGLTLHDFNSLILSFTTTPRPCTGKVMIPPRFTFGTAATPLETPR